jgi:hypothetical protein
VLSALSLPPHLLEVPALSPLRYRALAIQLPLLYKNEVAKNIEKYLTLQALEALVSVFLLPLHELDAEIHNESGGKVLLLLIHAVLL